MLSLNEQARYMYEQGMSFKDIGQELRCKKKRRPVGTYKLRPKERLCIVLDDLDYSWYPSQIETVRQMWEAGKHIADIAETFNRDQDEIFLTLLDLARKSKIKYRANGIFGDLQSVKG